MKKMKEHTKENFAEEIFEEVRILGLDECRFPIKTVSDFELVVRRNQQFFELLIDLAMEDTPEK
jgi:hypothetical protein